MDEREMLRRLAELISSQRENEKLAERNAKLKLVLTLLAKGAALATVLALPQAGRLFRGLFKEKSDWEEWKFLNRNYLKRTINRLEREKVVEILDNGDHGLVALTEKGKRKVLKMGLESLKISKPDRWDGKWRMVFYDINDVDKGIRERFRRYLTAAGFYPLQKSVYLHAYPCENEIEFLKYFLGVAGAVRIVIAEKIENDAEFRSYFGV